MVVVFVTRIKQSANRLFNVSSYMPFWFVAKIDQKENGKKKGFLVFLYFVERMKLKERNTWMSYFR